MTEVNDASKEEIALLSAMVSNPKLIENVLIHIAENDLTEPSCIAGMSAIVSLEQEEIPINFVTVSQAMKRLGSKPNNRFNFGPDMSGEMAEYVALSIRKRSERRRLLSVAGMIGDASRRGIDPEVIVNQAQKGLDEAFRAKGQDSTLFKDRLQIQLSNMRSGSSHNRRVPTGWGSVDKHLQGGLQLGQLDVIAGRTGMGKTSFATGLLYNIALGQVPSLMISIEMPSDQIVRKIMSSRLGIREECIAKNEFGEEEYGRLSSFEREFNNVPFYIDDNSRSLFDAIASIRRHVRHYGVKMVVVDYIQKVKAPRRDARYLEVGDTVDDLADLAKRLGVCIVALSQINRGAEGRTAKRPQLSDLSESGKIEEAASRVFLLYRDDYYSEDSDKVGECEVNIAKNRFGGTTTVSLGFDGAYTRFKDLK